MLMCVGVQLPVSEEIKIVDMESTDMKAHLYFEHQIMNQPDHYPEKDN